MEGIVRERRNILDIQNDYLNGQRKELSDLLRAWKGIKELDSKDPYSFFTNAGFHGLPFTGKVEPGNSQWWGGYCNHGNVLFPSWHRAYLHHLEKSLQSIKGCESVMLPFLDQTSVELLRDGLPWILTTQKVELDDGSIIDNPLLNYSLQEEVVDTAVIDGYVYSKPKGYTTVRFPLSGLYGTPDDIKETTIHNNQYPDHDLQVQFLNENIKSWLILDNPDRKTTGIFPLYKMCLQAPNYTLFSNTTSQNEWNKQNKQSPIVTSLELPHNNMHLCIGGFTKQDKTTFDPIKYTIGSNGDMGENETAAFDPIFFFHHCWIDLVFWKWQQLHGATEELEIIPGYKGTNTNDSQINAGQLPDTPLDVDSPLQPFENPATGKTFTTRDVTNIANLGYFYGPNSLDDYKLPTDDQVADTFKATGVTFKRLQVKGINRAYIRGSLVVAQYEIINGEKVFVGANAVLSRWNVQACENCQYHLDVQSYFDVPTIDGVLSKDRQFVTEVVTRDRTVTLPSQSFQRSIEFGDYSCEILE